jgi:hypothetical protein
MRTTKRGMAALALTACGGSSAGDFQLQERFNVRELLDVDEE